MAREIVDRFRVRSDKDGREYDAVACRNDNELRRPAGYRGPLDTGPTEFELADGRDLNPLGDDLETFEILGTDEVVRKVGKRK